jgi:metal-responsive CopG/Arc/MetJ family transcriptional regulator
MADSKQIAIRLNSFSLSELDRYVDGVRFRNRSHAIDVIINDWLERQRVDSKGVQQSIFPLVKSGKKKAKKND